MLYAHFEGFCVFALSAYRGHINRAGVACGELTDALAASTLKPDFDRLNLGASAQLPTSLGSDTGLSVLFRRIEFLQKLPGSLAAAPAVLPDNLVDGESNLKPRVLRKNLFRLGLEHSIVDAYEGDINRLLQRRNDVAHGNRVDGLDAATFENLESSSLAVMYAVRDAVTTAATDAAFRRGIASVDAA
jgi:hypothetical protein